MSGESDRGAARDQDQMEDQRAFQEDPRGRQEVSGQQPETQHSGGDSEGGSEEEEGRQQGRRTGGETGRDDAGEATGNPPNAG